MRDGAGLYAAVFLAITSGAGQGLYTVFLTDYRFRHDPVIRIIFIRKIMFKSLDRFFWFFLTCQSDIF